MEATINEMVKSLEVIINDANKTTNLDSKTKLYRLAVKLLQTIVGVCDIHEIELPDNGIAANVYLDEVYGGDTLQMGV